MDSIILHQFLVECDALHKKFDPANAQLVSEFAIDAFECLCVALSIVGRNADSEQHHRRAASLRGVDDHSQIVLHDVRREAPQTVVAAEFQDQEFRAEVLDGRGDAGFATFRRFATNTGVNYPMFVTLVLQPGLQQRGPRLVNIQSIPGGKTVAENKNGWNVCRMRGDSNKTYEKGQNSSHVGKLIQ